jgi:hypothetical protein
MMAVTRREAGTTVVDAIQSRTFAKAQTVEAQTSLKRGDAEVYPNHRIIVQAIKGSVGASQADVEIFEFRAPAALTLEEVQVYCTATDANASVDVKEAGVSVLEAAATPQAGAVVRPTITDAAIASGAAVTVHVMTDGTGSITDLHVTLIFKESHVA